MSPAYDYTSYYLNQAGYGNVPVFQGQRFQRGYGLGGFFASLFRSAVPMLKRGAKVAGRALLRTGLDVASDALSGANIKDSAQQRFKQTSHNLATQAVDHLKAQVGSGPLVFKRRLPSLNAFAPKRRRTTKKKVPKKKQSIKKRSKKRHTDIFG